MNQLKICLVSAEIAPFAKTGGLADVSAALSRVLHEKGHDVRVFAPLYKRVREGPWNLRPHADLQNKPLSMAGHNYEVSLYGCSLPGSERDITFVDCPALFARDSLYTSDKDEHRRFLMLSRVAIEACQWMQWAPDVFHCNDWHTGMLPLLLKANYSWDQLFASTKSILTIHNIGYQGVFDDDILDDIGLGDRRELLHQEDLQQGNVNYLKTGLLYADLLTTVSRTYAEEIQTAEFGMGLEGILKARAENLVGIVNGVDYSDWSPEQDALIPHPFSATDLSGKAKNKEALMQYFHLQAGAEIPVFGVVSRLSYQKGFELFPEILKPLLDQVDIRLVVLGSGEEKYEQYFQWLRDAYPQKVGFYRGFNNELAHLIEAGSDAFLMPSRYEPCGLNQMYSLKYGTVPIVRRTGGLADTVEPYQKHTGEGTGFVFQEFNSKALFGAIRDAIQVFQDREAWHKLMQNGMSKDFSWDRQADEYLRTYQELANT